jgi:phosphoglycerate kinase
MKKTVRDVDVAGKRVLLRVDFNIPMEKGKILEETRIHASLPTIQYLREKGARTCILTHIDRPDGYVVEHLRTDVIAARLADLLGVPVAKVNNCIGPEVEEAVAAMQPGDVLVLENVRFHPGEMVNDARFAARLAANADLFVNDAFASAHRLQASTVEVARYLPAVAGLLMERELSGLRQVQAALNRKTVLLLGGRGLADKTHFIDNHLDEQDHILLGGVLANTFLHAKGYETGHSDVEHNLVSLARTMLNESPRLLHLPTDVIVVDELTLTARTRIVHASRVPPTACIVDIGPDTIEQYAQIIEEAGTLIWNGPLGVTEMEPFAAGTTALATRIAAMTGVYRVACGGDTIAALEWAKLGDKMEYLSTGGAAFLDAIEDDILPATRLLADRPEDEIALNEDEEPSAPLTSPLPG